MNLFSITTGMQINRTIHCFLLGRETCSSAASASSTKGLVKVNTTDRVSLAVTFKTRLEQNVIYWF